MPGFKKSQSQSQSQSKNGGRRRKHTMRKVRRMKKSRKVMRGGGLKSVTFPDELRQIFSDSDKPELLANLNEAIHKGTHYETLDKFFYGLKGDYKNLALTTIAKHDSLNGPEYADVRQFLIEKSN